MALISISVLARKGGIGRTTSVLNLSSAWAKEGMRCLCIDLDSQASLSRCFFGPEAVESTHPAQTVAALFDERYDPEPEEIIQPTGFENIFLVAAGDALEEFNVTKPWETGAQQFALRRFLEEVSEEFDLVLIDNGPNTCGLSAWSSLVASNFVLTPVLCDAFGTQSIISVQRLVEQVQTSVNPTLEVLGYFINMRQKNAVMDAYENTLRKVHGPMVLTTVLPLAAAYRQAVAERTPILFKKGRSKAHQTIAQLAQEIGGRVVKLSEMKEAA